MAKKEKAKKQAITAGRTDKAAGRQSTAAAADKATVATAAADVKDNTKGTSTEFQAFISDLEASPPLNPLCHASAGHGCNTSDRQEEELPANKGKETLATVSAKASFAGLFSTNRRLTMDNKLSKFQIDEGTITLESNDLTDVQSKLGFCIVGYVAGKFPGLQAIRTLSKLGSFFQRHDSGWLVFRFARDDDRQRILDGGPYFIYGRPLLLKAMPDCFEFKEDDISLTPVWAILPSLPLECWHPNALGKIGSRLGTPIAMDSLTMRMERVSYARILVEVDASKTLVDHVEFKMPNGVTRRQPVVYEYTPKFCTECNRFGHHQNLCHDRQQPASATAIATVAVGIDAVTKRAATKKAQTEWTLVQRRRKTELKQPHTAATESKQKQSNEATKQKLKQGVTVTERKQQTVTETADVAAHERPESSKQRMSLKERRHSSPLRQKEAEVDTSASSCEPDSSGSTQHLMPGTTPCHGLKLQLGGETPLNHHEDWFWNVRGFNRPLKHNGVAHLIKNNRLCLLGILETKLATSAIARIINRTFPGWCQTNNFDVITGGRILIIWNPAVIDLVPEDISPQKEYVGQTFGIGAAYEHALADSWRFQLCEIATEKQLGATPTWYELKDITDCCLSLGLNDAPTTGCYFTWYSNSESNPVWCKLDRVHNNEWLEAGLLCNAHFSPPGCLSDHSPGIVSILDPPASKPKPFRFFNMWADHQDFMATVENGWNLNVDGTAQFCLCRKLKALKGHLKAFNNLHFSHISVRAKDADLALQDAQIQLESDPENATIRDSVRELRKKAVFLAEAERHFYYQKAKLHFLKMGDRNTKFFMIW
ncbi:UNVERIFIED_CONTAM: hypothetical protein Scaly_2178700 [Sesamum calycinum]|uniref:DUF4283 domain-containing protein n=1 Tax=Sesamum calycinum TaxID=2727403 RepID=A0AAW2MQL3_9LAMI